MKDPESVTPGSLVLVNHLTSRRGRDLNGKYGLIRRGATSAGRLPVEIFAGVFDGEVRSLQPLVPVVSLGLYNVSPLDDATARRTGYPTLANYLRNKIWFIFEKEGYCWHMCETSRELLATPGLVPTRDDLLTMVTLYSHVREAEGGVAMARRVVEHPDVVGMEPTDPHRSSIYFSLSLLLAISGRLEEGFETALAIEGNGCSKTIKRKVLWMIHQSCFRDEAVSRLRQRVSRAREELHPGDGRLTFREGEGFVQPEYVCGELCTEVCTVIKPWSTLDPSNPASMTPLERERLSRLRS